MFNDLIFLVFGALLAIIAISIFKGIEVFASKSISKAINEAKKVESEIQTKV